jgi:hypothetical protein
MKSNQHCPAIMVMRPATMTPCQELAEYRRLTRVASWVEGEAEWTPLSA